MENWSRAEHVTGGKVTIASAAFAANYKPPMVSSDSLMYLPFVQAGTWLYYNINVSCDSQAAGGCFVDRAAFSSWNLSAGLGTDQKGRRLWSIGGFVPAGTTVQFGIWATVASDGPVSLHIEDISTWVGGRNLNPSMVMGNCLTIIDNGCKG